MTDAGPPGLDKEIHHPTRLTVAAFLSGCAEAEFSAVRDYCGVTDSVLSKTVAALEKADYVSVRKGYFGKRPRTWLALTPTGRKALAAHLAALEALAGAAHRAGAETPGTGGADGRRTWKCRRESSTASSARGRAHTLPGQFKIDTWNFPASAARRESAPRFGHAAPEKVSHSPIGVSMMCEGSERDATINELLRTRHLFRRPRLTESMRPQTVPLVQH